MKRRLVVSIIVLGLAAGGKAHALGLGGYVNVGVGSGEFTESYDDGNENDIDLEPIRK